MKIKSIMAKLIAVALVVITVISVSPINAFALENGAQSRTEGHALVMKSESLTVAKKKDHTDDSNSNKR